MTRAIATFGILTALTLGASGCLPQEEAPTWSSDIRPLLIAHCGRCHNGTKWNENPDRVGSMSNFVTELPSPSFLPGAALALIREKDPRKRMPPPPAEPLKEWQIKMIEEWAENPRP